VIGRWQEAGVIERQAADHRIPTPDGRILAVDVTGAPRGLPVFLMHGTPGSRSGIKPRGILLYRLGIKLICYDRPGYGQSDRQEGRRVVDAAKDVEVIADKLGIERFAVVGRSGGGPHALAAAAMLPDRVTRAAVLVSLAPMDAPGLDWFAGMGDSNVHEYRTDDADRRALKASLTDLADRMREDPESHVEFIDKELSPYDRRVLQNVLMRKQITDSYLEAVRDSAWGWIDDALAFRDKWGFDLDSVDVDVRLWHGADDQFSPTAHTHWLASQIRASTVRVEPRMGHFGAVEILPDMLTWLTATAREDNSAAFVAGEARTGAGPAPGRRVDLGVGR
jgi:pimeloyl-ACP methyl ester carboxylesterase